jgi:primosomal protein N' (replication factor Y)
VSAPLKLKRQRSSEVRSQSKKFPVAELKPVASVLVDTPVSHLEGIYDYLVPQELSSAAVVGTKVLIEFGKAKTEGLILARKDLDASIPRLKPLLALSSPSGLIQPSTLKHIELVRNRFGGSFWNLLNQAIPSRVIREENVHLDKENVDEILPISEEIKSILGRADSLQLHTKEKLRWGLSLPLSVNPTWFISEIAKLRSHLGQVLLLVPDEKDLNSLRKVLHPIFGDNLVEYGSHLSKSLRYRNFLQIVDKCPRFILATRSGSFLPLRSDSTVIVYSDLDTSHYELHSPGWNTRDVTLLRSSDTSLIFVSASHSLEIERLMDVGWLERKRYKRSLNHNYGTSDGGQNYISQIKKAISKGNVLVSVAEKGYANLFLCSRCRNTASCECGGKLQIASEKMIPQCYLCLKFKVDWKCSFCGDNRPYVIAKGIDRTAEEIGRALNKAPILISSGSKQITELPSGNHVVLATAGSEPDGEYSGVILLDGERVFNRPSLRSEELARLLWFSLLCRASAEAEVFLSLPNNHPLVQSVLRNDSSYGSNLSLKERKLAKLPPYYRIAVIEGKNSEISKFAENLRGKSEYEITGPITLRGELSRLIVRSPLEQASNLVDLLDDIVKIQSIKARQVFKVRFDQFDI